MNKVLSLRLAKIVDRVATGDDIFTVKKPIKFKPEGTTMFSLINARMIRDAGYEFVRAFLQYDLVKGEWKLTAFFKRDGEMASHKFGGFSFGYGGEGPRGLVEFGEIFGIGLKPDKITSGAFKENMPERGVVDLIHVFG